jgi:hypothetical protein
MKHGDVESRSFLIRSIVEAKFLFFGTDFTFLDDDDYPELFEDLRGFKVENYLIECNWNQYLYHLANDEQRRGCDRHLSDNQLIRFMKKVDAQAPKIITIHGSDRVSSDNLIKKTLAKRLPNATIKTAIGANALAKDIYLI